MGYYIQTKSLPTFDAKKEALIKMGAKETDSNFKPDLICIVDNGLFAAIAYAYNEAERDVFAREDGRYKEWFILKNADRLSGYKEIKPLIK